MKVNKILSADLPNIDAAVKKCVNLGQWLLFKSAEDQRHFYLKTESCLFSLGERGQILGQHSLASEHIEIDEIFYFDDLPRPRSLSTNVAELSF